MGLDPFGYMSRCLRLLMAAGIEFAANKEGALEMAPNPRAPHQPQCPKMALGPSPNARFAPEAVSRGHQIVLALNRALARDCSRKNASENGALVIAALRSGRRPAPQS